MSLSNFSLRPSYINPVRLAYSGGWGEQLGKMFALIHGNIHFNRRSEGAGFFQLQKCTVCDEKF